MNQDFVEKGCSVCDVLNYDSQTGIYNEKHEDPKTGKMVPCDTNGRKYVNGERQ